MKFPSRGPAVLALAVLLAIPGRLPADDPDRDEGQERALKLLEESRRAYKGLRGYADEGRFVAFGTLDDRPTMRRRVMSLRFSRPNRIDLRIEGVRLVSDGRVMRTFVAALRAYEEAPAPEELTYEAIARTPIGQVALRNPAFLTIHSALTLCYMDRAVEYLMTDTFGIAPEADRRIGGRTITPLLIDQVSGPDFRLLVDPETKLLAGVEVVLSDEDARAAAPPGRSVAIERAAWLAVGAKAEAPGDEVFSTRLPDGYRKEESLGPEVLRLVLAGEPTEGDPADLVGRPAPEFRAVIADGGGTRPLSAADLAGKVALFAFWSARDEPSLESLRQVVALARERPDAEGRLVVLALGLDEDPGDAAGRRALFEAAVPEDGCDVPGLTLGLDATGRIAASLGIEDLPALFLLDGRGVICAAHVGSADRGDLGREIGALLEGRPIAAPGPGETEGSGIKKSSLSGGRE